MLTPGIVPTTGEDCESKRGEGYLHPSDPCLDILLQQCDAETPQDNPAICGFDPRDNPQGFRCINEAGQWSANVRECFPQYIDIMREKCGSDWDPGEYCLIIGPPKTVYTFGMKVSIGPGGSGEQRPGLHIIECFVDTEGQCIIDAPFNTGIMVSCDDMPVSARAACEASKKSGFDEMRYRYLEQDFWNRFDPEGRYKEVGEKTKEDYERELQDVLDNFKRELDRMGITNPCEDLSDAQCNEWLLNQNNCPGHPACETFDDVFNDYLRNNPDAEWCYNNRDACYDRILGTDHCALGNPLCADPSQSYRPNIEWLEHGPIEPARPCTADNVIGCFDDAPGPYDPLQGNEYPAGYQPTSFDKALKSGANFVSHLGVELLTETGLEAIKGRVPGFPALGVGVFLGVITADGGLDDPKSTWCRSNPWERSCQSLTIDAITGATGARLHDSVCTGTAVTNPLCWDPVPPTPPPPPPPTPRPCTPEDHTGCYD
jgi:hypothetical protein